jgi:RimJ/RimL family protein N-acetyltransferase
VNGRNISFRPLTMADMPMLHDWLQRPHVAEWWTPAPALHEVIDEFTPLTRPGHRDQAYIALEGDREIGYIQSYVVRGSGDGWWADETDPGARGIDQFLADADQLGRGLGTAMVRAFVTRLFDDPAVTKIQTDPDPRNARAIRCYERSGFRAVREVDTPDGRALLMIVNREGVA